MVSYFVIEEDSLVGYLCLSMCLLLRLRKWQTFRCGTKHSICCVVRRQPAHGGQVNDCGTVHCVAVILLRMTSRAYSGLSSASGR